MTEAKKNWVQPSKVDVVQCLVGELPEVLILKETYTLTILLVQEYGQVRTHGKDAVKIVLTIGEAKVDLKDNEDGSYTCDVTPLKVGRLRMAVISNSQLLKLMGHTVVRKRWC